MSIFLELENHHKSRKLNEDEKKFLRIIQKNSRGSFDSIAKKCGFSRQKLWRIKNRLEEDKTVWGYHAVVDDEKLDLKRYLILIKRTNNPLSTKQLDIITGKFKQETSELGVNIESNFYLHGSYDWFLDITAENIIQVKKFIEVFNRLLTGVASDIQIQEVIFPVAINNFTNPDLDQIKDFFEI